MTILNQKFSPQTFCTMIRFVTLAVFLTLPGPSSVLGQTKAYVTNADDQSVSVIDTASNTVVATVPVDGVPDGIAVTPNGAFAYVVNANDGTVSVINTATNTVTTTVPVGLTPQSLAVNPSGTLVYVANFGSDTVSVIDTATNTVTATIPTGEGPFAVAFSTTTIDSLNAQVQAWSFEESLHNGFVKSISALRKYQGRVR